METITVTTDPCRQCKVASALVVPREGYEAWRSGALIQNVLPTLTVDERELLMTGTHPQCWDELMSILEGAETDGIEAG